MAASLLAGGLRDPLAAAFGAAAAGIMAWRGGAIPLGPALWWLPWLAWTAFSLAPSATPWAGLPVLARGGAFALVLAAACRFGETERRAWLAGALAIVGPLGAAALWTGVKRGGLGASMWGLLPPYYNYTAFVLAIAGAAAAAAALAPGAPPVPRRWALASAAFAAACLLLAKSRSGLLGLGLALAWLGWRRWGWKAPAALAAAVALALALAPGAVRDRLLFKAGNHAGEARVAIWRRAAAIATAKPWHGTGPGQFGHSFRRDPVPVPGGAARWGFGTPYAHSEPLHAAAEGGWAGFALWLLGMWATLRGAFARRPDALETAGRAGLIAAAPALLFDNMLHLAGLGFAFAGAAALAQARSADEEPVSPPASSLAFAAFALASAVPGVWAHLPDHLDGEERLARAERAAAIYPGDSERHEDLAYAAIAAGRADRAYPAWERAEALAPFNAIYPWRRGQLLAAAGRHAEAETAFARAAALEPGFLAARAERAAALARLGRRAEARRELAAVRSEFLTRPERPVHSGYDRAIWSLSPEDLARAEAAVRR